MASFMTWTVPTGGQHPRLGVSSASGLGPSPAFITSRIMGSGIASLEYAQLVTRVKELSSRTTTRDSDFYQNKDPINSFAVAMVSYFTQSGGDGAIAIALAEILINGFIAHTPSSLDYTRSAALQLAYLYDYTYHRGEIDNSQRRAARLKIAEWVDALSPAPANERWWGHYSGHTYWATAALAAILGDFGINGDSGEDKDANNATWIALMHAQLDTIYDGIMTDAATSYFAIHKHYGDTDGGTYKGSGVGSYFKSTEEFLLHLFPCLRSAIGLSLGSYSTFWSKTVEWLAWHFRWRDNSLNGIGHTEANTRDQAYWHPAIHAHLLQYTGTHPQEAIGESPQQLCGVAKWLCDRAQLLDYHIYGSYHVWNVLFKESRAAVPPTIDIMNNGQMMKVFRNSRKIVVRNGWMPNSFSMTACAARFTGGHQRYAERAGHFELSCFGDKVFHSLGFYNGGNESTSYRLLSSTDEMYGGHWHSFYDQANAFNICTIYHNDESKTVALGGNRLDSSIVDGTETGDYYIGSRSSISGTKVYANIGGTTMPKHTDGSDQPNDWAHFVSEAKWNYETFAADGTVFEPVETPDYCHFIFDLKKCYWSGKLSKYNRHFLILKNTPMSTTPIVIIWDDMTTSIDQVIRHEQTQIFQLCSARQPTISGSRLTFVGPRNVGKCVVDILLPLNIATARAINEKNETWVDDGVVPIRYPGSGTSFDDCAAGGWRTKIWPSVETTTPSFLAVFYSTDGITTDFGPDVKKANSDGYIGIVWPEHNYKARIATASPWGIILGPIIPPPDPVVNDEIAKAKLGRGPLGVLLPIPSTGSVSGRDMQQIMGYTREPTTIYTPPPPPHTNPPAAPTGLVGVAGDNCVALTWDLHPDYEVYQIRVYRQQQMSDQTWSAYELLYAYPRTSVSDMAYAPNWGNYRFRLSAVTPLGGESEFSDPTDIMSPVPIPTAPRTPTGLYATLVGDSFINLDWNDNLETGVTYRLERAVVVDGVTGAYASVALVALSEYSDTSVINGTTYRYRVFATKYGFDSPPSVETEFLTPAPGPPSPGDSGLSIDAADTTPTPVPGISLHNWGTSPTAGQSIDKADTSPTGITGASVDDA